MRPRDAPPALSKIQSDMRLSELPGLRPSPSTNAARRFRSVTQSTPTQVRSERNHLLYLAMTNEGYSEP